MRERTRSVSILNHVLGPIMRGPSSSHTAGAYHIASMARDLLGAAPRRAEIAFDPGGSYGRTYSAQGADRAFAMGLMGKPLTDKSFFTALADAAATAAGNIVKRSGDIEKGVEVARSIDGVSGALIIVGDKFGSWGEIKLV